MKAGDSREEFVRLLKGALAEPQGAPQAAAAVQPQASPAPAPAPTTPPRVAASSEAPGRADNSLFLLQQRKREQAASGERLRVLQLLDNDKKEREARWGKNVAGGKASSTSIAGQGAPKSHSPSETAISFRMFDGLSLKAKFPSSAVLATDVRKFIDEYRTDGDHPYSFLQILTPLPNKQITISEENSTLSELDLSPTCTLVLVPISSSPASAYSGGGGSTEGGGIFSRICGLLYSIVTTILGVGYHPPIPASVNAELGKGQSLPTASFSSLSDASTSGQASSREEVSGARIRTLHDGRGSDGEEADRKYYNGNQVCFLGFSREG
ncbi:unnamed protein product [Tuber melanosporum]|uniref:(Perigord truffle) hypothetical protein n=1 Tax=Tuber melanosporum (strain Mel28) TaxID=656061 RepID=D5G8P0_TUBMM|nr:uncharacterized protein GSTUM_00003062001 [Tuber melanosporum]CAZ80883.1 unnamed protein product [Tuber melanosporum]